MEEPEVNEYPDSDKLYVMVGSAPGGDPGERAVDAAFRRSDAVSYEEGELARSFARARDIKEEDTMNRGWTIALAVLASARSSRRRRARRR